MPERRKAALALAATVAAALAINGCGSAGAAEVLPACRTPRAAPSVSPTDATRIAATRDAYVALLAQTDPTRVATNKRITDADKKGDLKGVRAALKDSLNAPHPIFDWLHTVDVPDPLKDDLSAYVSADEAVRRAEQAYARAQTDQQLAEAQHARNVALRIGENATNQFRVDLGMAPFSCPYSGP